MSIKQPVKVQNWGGAFQVEVISDPSVKQELFGWMSVFEVGPQSSWRFANMLDSKKLGVLRQAHMYATKRPGSARSGYLCFYPKLKVVIFVEDVEYRKDAEVQRTPRVSILRMRHSPSMYNNKGSVFAATLSVSDSTLWIEDVLVKEGVNLWTTHSFSKRWDILKNWFENDWAEDGHLQRGLIIKPIQPGKLESFQSEPGDAWDFIPEEAGKRRLLWKDKRITKVVLPSYPQKQPIKQSEKTYKPVNKVIESPEPVKIGILDTYFPSLPNSDGSMIAIAKRDGTETYSLYSFEKEPLDPPLAVVRKMNLSLALRTHCIEQTKVKVEWNTSFGRWEITDVNVSLPVSPKSAFIKTNA